MKIITLYLKYNDLNQPFLSILPIKNEIDQVIGKVGENWCMVAPKMLSLIVLKPLIQLHIGNHRTTNSLHDIDL